MKLFEINPFEELNEPLTREEILHTEHGLQYLIDHYHEIMQRLIDNGILSSFHHNTYPQTSLPFKYYDERKNLIHGVYFINATDIRVVKRITKIVTSYFTAKTKLNLLILKHKDVFLK